MGNVTITINGRPFAIGCEDGKEEAVASLGRQFDAHVSKMAGQAGQIGDLRLFLMTALVLADKLRESEAACQTLQKQIATFQAQRHLGEKNNSAAIQDATQALLDAAIRAETLAGQLERGLNP